MFYIWTTKQKQNNIKQEGEIGVVKQGMEGF